jgi:hypothetical protein
VIDFELGEELETLRRSVQIRGAAGDAGGTGA